MSDLFNDIFGSKKSTEVQQTPGQAGDIAATNAFKSGTVMPAWQDYMAQSKAGYAGAQPGMNRAAQNLSGYAGQVGQTLGETGESAVRTGTAGLEQFFNPQYGQEQFAAAMQPIQGQYQQNVANQGATFGGAGQLGSARQALAGQQLAGSTNAAQMQAAAGVMNNLNNQRLQAGSQLMQGGQGQLNSGLAAMGTGLGAAERPMDWQTTYGKQLGMTPSQLYTPQYPGQTGSTTTSTDSLANTVGSIFAMFSDKRLKENILHQGKIEGVDVYSYNYVWSNEPQFGVMAQDLLISKYANAVGVHETGYYMVDYAKLPEAIRARAFA
jgi:hypothetical protein